MICGIEIDSIEKYLATVSEVMAVVMNDKRPDGWRYNSPADLVLAKGRSFQPRQLPPGYKPGIIKQCFYNAALLAVTYPKLTYVEGYAISILPVEHAWCIDASGAVVDNTWCPHNDIEGAAYFGIPFKTHYLIQKSVLEERYASLLFDGRGHFPIMKEDPTDYIHERYH